MGDCLDDPCCSRCHPHGPTIQQFSSVNEKSTNNVYIENDHLYNTSNAPLKITSLNVCGLVKKLHYPDFIEFVNAYDIICLSETKLDECDILNVHVIGYKFFAKNRKSRRKSGGVGIFVKNTLMQSKLFTLSECNLSNMMVFHLHEKLCGFSIVGCAIYVEPENSPYSQKDVFECIENVLINFSGNNEIMLLGDFNARSACINEFIISDEYNFDINDDNIRITERMDNEQLLIDFGIPYERFSRDTKSNNFGRRMVDMCKNLGLLIVNGRAGNDAGVGKLTCKDASLVDYVIASPRLLSCIYDFDVLPFHECLSDIHCPIEIVIKCDTESDNNIENDTCLLNSDGHNLLKRPKWEDHFTSAFNDNISDLRVEEIIQDIESIYINNVCSQSGIDNIYENIKHILHNSAVVCGSIKVNNHKRKYFKPRPLRKKKQPWWNNDCEIARSKFNFARKANIIDSCKLESESKRKLASNAYKRTIKQAMNKYHKELNNKIRILKSKNPKDFWKIINCDKEKDDIVSAISCEIFAKHFETLNENMNIENNFQQENINVSDESSLNAQITTEEIRICIAKIKNNKACGYDRIINEFLKCSVSKMLNLYEKLFNLILKTGVIPNDWVIGIIKPIYKNKGSKSDVDNYRGITLLSCMGKLFTFILNERLKVFVEANNILCEEQVGFRSGYSTSDHIFTLHFVINMYLNKGKKLYGTFVDYRKAFDSIDRVALWRKLINSNINGAILRVIHNMYDMAKSCVKSGGNISDFFMCRNGVRQGENLSPLLFGLFLNDMIKYISSRYQGLSLFSNVIHETNPDETVQMYMKLYILLYADDTVILAESLDELQKALYAMESYCKENNLQVNVSKTKVIVFSKGKIRKLPKIVFNNIELDVVFSYIYLGVLFNYNGKFNSAQKNLYDKASRAMFGLIAKCRRLRLPLDIQLKLFDSVVKPIMLYGCEVWGPYSSDLANKLQLRFLKIILGLRKTTTTTMVRGETGSFPLQCDIQQRVLNYWLNLVNFDNNRISKAMYNCMYEMHVTNVYSHPWIKYVKCKLDDLGLSYIFACQGKGVNKLWFKNIIKFRILDQYRQDWHSELYNHDNCKNYRIFKHNFEQESYLIDLPWYQRNNMLKYRTRNFYLPVNVYQINADPMKSCILCNYPNADEYHYIMDCTYFNDIRRKLLNLSSISNSSNVLSFERIMNDNGNMTNLSHMMKNIMTTLKS